MSKPLMSKATAVWLVDNTTLSFIQIADFCGMHELEVQGIADGDVAIGVKGFDPVSNNQLDAIEIERADYIALLAAALDGVVGSTGSSGAAASLAATGDFFALDRAAAVAPDDAVSGPVAGKVIAQLLVQTS